VSDNSLLERATEDCHRTLDVGVCLGADCTPNEWQKPPFCPIKRSDNFGGSGLMSENHRITF
jgi:hypothetical protein